jgi:hypothetical protein
LRLIWSRYFLRSACQLGAWRMAHQRVSGTDHRIVSLSATMSAALWVSTLMLKEKAIELELRRETRNKERRIRLAGGLGEALVQDDGKL